MKIHILQTSQADTKSPLIITMKIDNQIVHAQVGDIIEFGITGRKVDI